MLETLICRNFKTDGFGEMNGKSYHFSVSKNSVNGIDIQASVDGKKQYISFQNVELFEEVMKEFLNE
jgi:hypothetical protein